MGGVDVNIINFNKHINIKSRVIEALVHLCAMETVHPYLETLLLARLLQLLLGGVRLDLLSALPLARDLAHVEFARSKAHGLPEVLEGLSDFYALFLDEVVLNVLEFDEHFF